MIMNREAIDSKKLFVVHPLKFLTWMIIVSVVMIFASLTSAYIVRKGDGNWLEFDLPALLWVNTVIIILSSVTLHWAYFSAKKDNIQNLRIGLFVTTLLGVLFVVGQVLAWQKLVDAGVYFAGESSNASGSFLYVFTGLHAAHLLGGMIYLFIVNIDALRYKIHSKNLLRLEMCATYWHFMDALWIYLFLFLLVSHS
jgi:cytochrome c oxidase subunit III